ncbi:MAG TPA: DUF2516 family protein [Nocardioides sp.]|uniref:DUF2516 family protein n=1 Tax=Nocardioides sp. TaxID=35761 RepID=UPI002E3170E8|nr:DUF2516 family protein [Nocardioides sp.]HEX5089573.1 DUF2516 family protein [Nocardioides sp.]
MDVFQVEGTIMLVVFFVLLAIKIYAFGSALLFSGESYSAANKLTKPAWCIILGLGVAVQLIFQSPLGILSIAFTIAAFVYLADVRPALANLTRR